ncbi:MAG: hypothetical protein GWP59_09155 [Chlamydiales bacterium]|nr:hypothetical protein [Chlamydiales bacterium]
MDSYVVYEYCDDKIKNVVEEDVVGWYTYVYFPPFEKMEFDFLQDAEDISFEEIEEKFSLKKDMFKKS